MALLLGALTTAEEGAAQERADTLWRPDSGIAMLVWDSVLTLRSATPIDTVEVPFAYHAVFRFAEPVDSFVVYRNGVLLDSAWVRSRVDWSAEPIWELWPVGDEPGRVRRYEACRVDLEGSESCGAVALRRSPEPSTRLATPRDTVPALARRVEHRGGPFLLGIADGARTPRDTVDVRPGDVLDLDFVVEPDSVTPGESRGERASELPWPLEPPHRWTPRLEPGEVRVVWICAWWGRTGRRCDHVALRGASSPPGPW
jgi:hypothetical protein